MVVPEFRSSAVVLGGSISGLLAARVLADFFSSVTVVDRDVLPDKPTIRRGVPQGGLPHVPLARGTQIMEELFPGFLDQLVAGGGRVWKDGDLSRFWMFYGGHHLLRSGKIPNPESLATYYVNRPFLEWHLRRRVSAIAHVHIRGGYDVVRLTSTRDRHRVTGVVVARRGSRANDTLLADLVVDATGRGSRTPVFLEDLGYRRPREDELRVGLGYAGLLVHVPPGTLHENLVVAGPQPSHPVACGMLAGENDTYTIGVSTVAGRNPPTDRAGMFSCLAEMTPAYVTAAACRAEPLADVVQYRFPSNRWRRYDRLTRTPDGLIVVGDAMCSLNPTYGQGMSIAATEAIVLHQCLQRGDRCLPRRFFRAAAKAIRVAWQTAVSSDLTLPQIKGPRPLSIQITNAYLDRVLTAAETDPAVMQRFLRLIGMVDPPSRLVSLPMMLRVVRADKKQIVRHA